MPSSLALGQVGVQYVQDGTNPPLRLGKSGEQMASELQPRYFEQNYRGNLFMIDSDAVTAAAAHATKGAMGTAKFVNGFYNPLNSGKHAVIVSANVATTSGTPGGPYFYNCSAIAQGFTQAATGTIRSGLIGGAGASLMVPAVNVVLVASDADTTALKQLSVLGGPAAIAAGAGIYNAYDELAGKIIVPPGFAFGICVAAAGTSHVIQSTLVWMEVLT